MKSVYTNMIRLLIITALVYFTPGAMPKVNATDIDFSNLSLNAGSYWNGSSGAGGFSSGGAFFNNSYYYDTTYLYESWYGWSYSNITNTSIV